MLVELADEAATEALGGLIAACLQTPLLVFLRGELGAGKTTLCRGLLRGLGYAGLVKSPTYTLVEPYELGDAIVYHVDLYRVAEAEELRYLGWNELDRGFRLVEWPERVPGLRRSADIEIELCYARQGRVADIKGLSERGAAVVAALAAAYTANPEA